MNEVFPKRNWNENGTAVRKETAVLALSAFMSMAVLRGDYLADEDSPAPCASSRRGRFDPTLGPWESGPPSWPAP